MISWDSQHFLANGRAAGVDRLTLHNANDTARRILQANHDAPVVFTLRHLAHLTDVPYAYLRRIVERNSEIEPYRVFTLRRGGAGPGRAPRIICAPEPLLLRTQRWIHENILTTGALHEASVAYAKNSSIVRAAEKHCGASWLVKLDVSNFFDSILEPRVYEVFRKLGYQPLLALELARICTRLRFSGNVETRYKSSYVRIPQYSSHGLGHLPQGAPTSPLLANLVCIEFDEQVTKIAQAKGLRYTRYADDLTLSFRGKGFSRKDAAEVINQCYDAMKSRSLWPNRTKTRVVPPGARKIVLGLLVDGKRPSLTREFRDQMKAHLYFIKKFGPAEHARNRGFDSVIGLQNHVFGLGAYALGVDRKWAREQMRELRSLPWPTAFSMPV